MNIFNVFLCKLFTVITVLFCYTNFVYAEQLQLCSEDEYLYRCGQFVVGTNWLKGIKGKNTTPDYYSYGSSDSETTNIVNLRKFFAGLEISYIPKDGTKTSVSPSDYEEQKNKILNKICAKDGNLVDIECKKCPNNAKVSVSTVERKISDGKIDDGSWRIYTIADCYIDEFSDHTGTFVYVPIAAATSSANKTNCYYSNNFTGSELVLE